MRGFSLIEIMVTLFIAALLTAISIPIYSSYFMHQHRLAAEISLFKIGTQLEKYYLQHNTYEQANLADLGFSATTTDDSYHLTISTADKRKFVLQALPQGRQMKDTTCATLTLNSQGEKSVTGSGTVKDCWG